MAGKRYSMSFTTGGLFHRESLKLAVLFVESNDWNAVRDKVLSDNLLQARTLNTSKRVCREIIARLKTLDPRELNLLLHASPQEQAHLLWVAVCRRYTFIADFAIEMVWARAIELKADLQLEHFDTFFDRKSEWHPELEGLRSTTRNKLRQVLFKMLREADLLTANNTINAPLLSPRLLELLAPGQRQDMRIFPAFECSLDKETR